MSKLRDAARGMDCQVRELFSYDPLTGIFIRLKSPRMTRWAGKRAGSINSDGYRVIRVGGRDYYAHRLAWFYVTGHWPRLLDHIDGDTDHNAFANLREATKSSNGANRGKQINNTTGFKGVRKRYHRWIAQIHTGGKNTYLGSFPSKELAAAAYAKAASIEFGQFAKS